VHYREGGAGFDGHVDATVFAKLVTGGGEGFYWVMVFHGFTDCAS
jgi:hypothetical protein